MRESILFWLLTSVFLTTVMLAEAQQPKKVPRVGYLSASSAAEASARTAAFRVGMRELGYVDGKNIILEFRYAQGKFDRLPELASELVRLKVDVIVTAGPSVTRPVKEATATIAIVMTNDSDPVRKRLHRQPCATGRKHHGTFQLGAGVELEAAGDFKGSRTQTRACGYSRNVGDSR
jgi:putative ABC transport system substrate-binding protein